MGVPYVPQAGDQVYLIPDPAAFGWAFARSADPSNVAAARGYMLRRMGSTGYVFSLYADPMRAGAYLLNSAPGNAANPTGVAEGAWLNEQNYRWRRWAVDNGIDPDTVTNPSGGGPVWVAKGEQLPSLAAAAAAWGWKRV